MSEIETAVENLIQFHIDENDFITRVDAEQYFEEGIASALDDANFITGMEAEQYTDQCVSDLQDDISELIVRIEALEEFKALEDKAREDKALDLLDTVARAEIDSVRAKALKEQEPRAVNQIDWIMTTHGLIAGYDSKAMLESYVRSVLPADQSHQAEMLIAMVLTTARNLINKKLEAES
jgi:phosphoglycerate dehydrogenase-like enzyme